MFPTAGAVTPYIRAGRVRVLAVTRLEPTALLVWRGIRAALGARDVFGGYLAFGITLLFGVQLLFNVGVVLGVVPSPKSQA